MGKEGNKILKNIFFNLCTVAFVLVITTVCCAENESSKEDYEKLKRENERLKEEIKELKFGAEKLYKDAESYYNNKEYEKAKKAINLLVRKHPTSSQAVLGKKLLSVVEEALKTQNEQESKDKKLSEALDDKSSTDIHTLPPIMADITTTYDEYEKITWYRSKLTPYYFLGTTGISLYFSVKDGNKVSNLRLSVQYYAKNWLFIKNYSFSIDGKIFNYIPLEIKRDHDSSIREWSDEEVNKTTYEIIKAIINSKTAKIKFNGENYYDEKEIMFTHKIAIKDVLDVYKALGGSLSF